MHLALSQVTHSLYLRRCLAFDSGVTFARILRRILEHKEGQIVGILGGSNILG